MMVILQVATEQCSVLEGHNSPQSHQQSPHHRREKEIDHSPEEFPSPLKIDWRGIYIFLYVALYLDRWTKN